MRGRLRPRLTYANVMSTLAVFLALGVGGAYAAGKINGRQIKKGSIPGNRLKPESVTGRQVNSSTLGVVPNAAVATIGRGPAAWARVAANGTVVAGRGITSANISLKFSSSYCFHGLAFGFKSAAVTPDYSTSAGSQRQMAQFALGDPFGDCAAIPGTQAEVETSVPTSFGQSGFFIQFFN